MNDQGEAQLSQQHQHLPPETPLFVVLEQEAVKILRVLGNSNHSAHNYNEINSSTEMMKGPSTATSFMVITY